jgi:pimeloyl-ACP methyl ester carboxylesterase
MAKKVLDVNYQPHRLRRTRLGIVGAVSLLFVWASFSGEAQKLIHQLLRSFSGWPSILTKAASGSPYGTFPQPDDPFHFLPCTNATVPPPLDARDPEKTWAKLFDPNPDHWSWGNASSLVIGQDKDSYADRGIYLCGYLDVPLDYTNKSDTRIARLAVARFQVSGLKRVGSSHPSAGSKSTRTIVVEPGGPGGSGTSYVWRAAEAITRRLSDGNYDVLGWDPRGVNASLPAISCFPYDALRDRWSLMAGQYREESAAPDKLIEVADAMNNATFRACWERFGDIPRFVSTAFVARDMDAIREALGEDELTGYLVSYGTGIGQTYANMFPGRVGRLILDGTEYVRDHRELGGFGWTALDNVTDAWHDGFLGECLNAGPEHCALAKPLNGQDGPVVLEHLEERMNTLVTSLVQRPITSYTKEDGPSLITYSALVAGIYQALYNAASWPALAHMLYDLEHGNSTLAAIYLTQRWDYDPTIPCPAWVSPLKPVSEELGFLVICADSYDAPQPADGLQWYKSLWANMTAQAWISGNSRFYDILPCRHFTTYWPEPAEVYRGDLNHTLRNPVLLIAETYDPATPLRNGRRLLKEMTHRNARLIVHHGYGHSSRDKSTCTDAIAKDLIIHGKLPEETETPCYADEKPYLYGVTSGRNPATLFEDEGRRHIEEWKEHVRGLAFMSPGVLPRLGTLNSAL